MPRLAGITEKEKLAPEYQEIFDYLVMTRGAVSPGFSVLLNSPITARRIGELGTYVRFESALPQIVRELAAHASSVEMGNPYEGSIHTNNLVRLEANKAVIDAVNNKTSLDGLPAEASLPARMARELLRDKQLSQATFDEAQKRYGDQGVVDLIGNIGYYAMLACLHVGLEIRPQ
ncbi:MAG TPA: carboxymuconolactone decarboxylase family protein [Dehalococcoidia bacterium]|nr:carboxymuconolactone decarboxylase family protein [Dehalococcoidia bacterium]